MTDTLHDIRRLLAGEEAVVVAVSAPHCPHCRAIAPLLTAAASRHSESVRYLEVSAVETLDLAVELRVRGTPTVLAFHDGEEVARHVGAGSPGDVERIFQAAVAGSARARSIGSTDRWIRTGSGAALAAVGAVAGVWWLAALGAAFLAGGWYDRLGIGGRGRARTVAESEGTIAP